MKKFLLSLAVALMAVCGHAEEQTLFEGSEALSWSGTQLQEMTLAATSDVTMVITIETTTNEWWQFKFVSAADWEVSLNLGGNEFVNSNNAPEMDWNNPKTYTYEYQLDADQIALVKGGLFAQGSINKGDLLLKKVVVKDAAAPTPGANHALKLTQDAAKANPWDTQVFINIKNLNEGEKYTIELDVIGGAEFTLGTETIDDAQKEHMTEWNASAVFSYTDEIKVTTDWSRGLINAPGVTDVNCHTHCTPKVNGGEISHAGGSTSSCDVAVHAATKYAATAILLNVGKTVGELIIDNIVVKDSKGNVVYTEDFEDAKVAADNKSATAYFPGWQGAKWAIVESAIPTSVEAVEANEADEVAYDLFGNAGATKGFMVKGGKKVYVK